MRTLALVRLSGGKWLKQRSSHGVLLLALASFTGCANLSPFVDAIDTPLTNVPADSARGKEVFISRDAGNCVLCQQVDDVIACLGALK